ncbi:MAG: alanine racemase, partial [Rhodothermales bacterium]
MPRPTPADAALHLAPTVAEINLDHLRHNTRLLQQQAGRVPLMGVVKADAYGHGVVEVTWALRAEGM